ncbi:MAG: ATP-binding protein [Armatimonadota bacterium]
MGEIISATRSDTQTLDGKRQNSATQSWQSKLKKLRSVAREFGLSEEEIATEQSFIDVFTLPAATEYCRQARSRVEQLACSAGVSDKVKSDLVLAVGEAVTNAIEHGSKNTPNSFFTVRCLATPKRVCVSVSDNGPGFNPDELPSLVDAQLRERGRGIHCILALMDEVRFEFASGTSVRMVKFR